MPVAIAAVADAGVGEALVEGGGPGAMGGKVIFMLPCIFDS